MEVVLPKIQRTKWQQVDVIRRLSRCQGDSDLCKEETLRAFVAALPKDLRLNGVYMRLHARSAVSVCPSERSQKSDTLSHATLA